MAATVKAICIHQTGGPEVLSWEDVAVGEPGADEVRLRHTAVGLNFIDINHRTGGRLPGGFQPSLPFSCVFFPLFVFPAVCAFG